MSYRVSVLQYRPQLLKAEENFARISTMLSELDTDLVVLPELALSGYVFSNVSELPLVAESIPEGRIFNGFRDLARARNMSIVYGFAESAGDQYYNSCALVNPDGSFYIYRKIHLFNREKLFFSPGNRPFAVFPGKGGVKLGLMICFDWQFPEAARSLGLLGAQIICHPSNLVLPWCQEAMKTRSLENRVFSITANRTGTEVNADLKEYFTGMSQIVGCKGEILLRMNETEEAIYTVEIDPDLALNKAITERNNAYLDRRLDMYTL
ncbi:MAG: nitrilase-related carbon-nitrogen hydrolase [Candidatus Cloacimonadaceae bacterium]|jgi:predicted amidohydrolase|nr:beta-ureidopropionase [Candidatus Cloacimonadota bacterium]MDD2542868.1 beta-ureidopropionase [Candidatus Cloacimonadota bacterium]MDD4033842.1 beta-ureidopropionase [Candidatus Cloacimonadota bacterium]MDY0336320.1 nitrilase-related carbon-nitrogen hydrolase [Candidatus Cloacimonadaceae bacterium]HPF08476.1 nitrilase-related carbon-nitrogen hydrolase [Candidatus Cloacimonadota bacterium]